MGMESCVRTMHCSERRGRQDCGVGGGSQPQEHSVCCVCNEPALVIENKEVGGAEIQR